MPEMYHTKAKCRYSNSILHCMGHRVKTCSYYSNQYAWDNDNTSLVSRTRSEWLDPVLCAVQSPTFHSSSFESFEDKNMIYLLIEFITLSFTITKFSPGVPMTVDGVHQKQMKQHARCKTKSSPDSIKSLVRIGWSSKKPCVHFPLTGPCANISAKSRRFHLPFLIIIMPELIGIP